VRKNVLECRSENIGIFLELGFGEFRDMWNVRCKRKGYVWLGRGGGGLWGDVQGSIKDSTGGDCVFIVVVIAGGGLFVDMEPFYGGQVWAFFVEL
jgi:hypothetical protein